MPNLSFTGAFARYGAKLRNPQWSVCAEAPDGALVVSLWEQHFDKRPVDGALYYRDFFARWGGPGNVEFRGKVAAALADTQRLRLVIAHAKKPEQLSAGASGAAVGKTFSVREDLIGTVLSIDGDNFVFRFARV